MKKQIFCLSILLITYSITWGMLYKTVAKVPHPVSVFLVPYPESEELKEWQAKTISYEKISIPRTIAEKSEYIKNIHQNVYKKEGRLKQDEEFFVSTNYPEGLKALVKLYKLQARNKQFVLSTDNLESSGVLKKQDESNLNISELSNLIKSNLIDYLKFPKPQENIQKKLDDAVTIFLVPYPESETLQEWKAKNQTYEKIPMLRKIAEKSEYIKKAHGESLQKQEAFYDVSNERIRLNNGEEIFIPTDYPKALKALVELYTQELENKPVTLLANELINLAGSNLIDFLQIPELKNDLGELLAECVTNNSAASIGSFYKLNDGQVLDSDAVKDIALQLIKTKKIDSNLLSDYSARLQYKISPILNDNKGVDEEHLLFFDGDIKIYGKALKSAYIHFVIVDKNNKRQLVETINNFGMSTHLPLIGRTEIVSSPDKTLYCVKCSWGVGGKQFFIINRQQLKMISLPNEIIDCCFFDQNILYTVDFKGVVQSLDLANLNFTNDLFFDPEKEKVIADLRFYNVDKIIQLLCNSNSENSTILCVTKNSIYTINKIDGQVRVGKDITFKNSRIKNVIWSNPQSTILASNFSISQGWSDNEPIFNLLNINQQGSVVQDESYFNMRSGIRRDHQDGLTSFVIDTDKLIISYYMKKRNDRDQAYDIYFHFMIPSSLNYWEYRVKQNDASYPIRLGQSENIIINRSAKVATSFPLWDSTMIEMLNYFDLNKKSDVYGYNKKLDGILLLTSLLRKDISFPFDTTAQEVFDTCLPKCIQQAVKNKIEREKVIEAKLNEEKQNQQAINQQKIQQPINLSKPDSNDQQDALFLLRNYAQTMYNTLKDKIYTYSEGLFRGTIATAAVMKAVYKFFRALPDVMYFE